MNRDQSLSSKSAPSTHEPAFVGMRAMIMRIPATVAAGLLLATTGCVNMSGLGADSNFKCKAPDGIPCQAMSGVYANAKAGVLPSQQLPTGHGESGGAAMAAPMATIHSNATGEGAMLPVAAISPTAPVMRAAVGAPQAGGYGAVNVPTATLGAIRSDPTVVRIWVAPWEDADGDLVDQSYVYVTVDSGRWLIERNRQRIKRDFAPVRAPAMTGAPAPRTAMSANTAGDDGAADANVAQAGRPSPMDAVIRATKQRAEAAAQGAVAGSGGN